MTVQALGSYVPRIAPTAWVHPAATVIGDVVVADGCSVWPGAVLRGDYGSIRVGPDTSVQDNVVIHAGASGTTIGGRCIIGHLALIEDAVVEDAALIGAGARLLAGAHVCSGASVAAGAVVLGGTRVTSGTRAQGVPANVVPAREPTAETIGRWAERYAEQARRVAASAEPLRASAGPGEEAREPPGRG